MTIGINYYVNRTQMIKFVLGVSIIPYMYSLLGSLRLDLVGR